MLGINKEFLEIYEINKSKFISLAFPILTEEQVEEILARLDREYRDATHICYAYVLSSPRTEKCSDDGEPSGTAGKPLLELIKKKSLSNVLLVVVRYFGGIKLGAGGLVRAYTNSGNLVLRDENIVELIEVIKYSARVDCGDGAKLINSIKNLGGRIIEYNYGEQFEIIFTGEIGDKLKSVFKGIEIIEVGREIDVNNN